MTNKTIEAVTMNRISEERKGYKLTIEQVKNHIEASEKGMCEVLPIGFELMAFKQLLEYMQAEKEQKPVAWRWYAYGEHHITQHETKMRLLLEDGANIQPLYAEPVLAQQQTEEFNGEKNNG